MAHRPVEILVGFVGLQAFSKDLKPSFSVGDDNLAAASSSGLVVNQRQGEPGAQKLPHWEWK